MDSHLILGALGEEAACRYLMHKGYTLLARNWRVHPLEIDIVAEWFGEVIFVEVKTRSNEDFQDAVAAVDWEKKENLVRAARAFMAYHHLDQPYRFDIITVVGEMPPFTLRHWMNAFTPQGVREHDMEKFRRSK